MLLALAALGTAGCGASDDAKLAHSEPTTSATNTTHAEAEKHSEAHSAEPGGESRSRDRALARRPKGEGGLHVPATRARLVVQDSDFGRVLFDANGQVVYAFENDRTNRSNCTSEDCVDAWPPVLTQEQPSADRGVQPRLLGTIRRSNGSLQVTYNGRPLYFYAHEAPGEIKCHNVDLHGGLWWVVTPQGDPAV